MNDPLKIFSSVTQEGFLLVSSDWTRIIYLSESMERISGIAADRLMTVLLASGFRQDERVEESLNLGIKGFIQKPFSLGELSLMIKKILS